ncbi:MAG TPA: CPBP family intramembrane glutamic endopeptidase [Rhizomicrobium sp.]|nr:CPBP family intramembrane glutamic endopeptidase [Rhizomicrobium sp.]
MATQWQRIFLGPDGRLLSPFWRALLFYLLARWVLSPLLDAPSAAIARAFHIAPNFNAGNIALSEAGTLALALLLTWAFAAYEHRAIGDYGLPLARALRLPTLEGAILGAVLAGVVALGMLTLGGMQVNGLSPGGGAWRFALIWLAVNILIGLAEEMFYRGYLLKTLWQALGFWPAAILVSLPFTADHYFYKPGENIWDVITLMSFSLLCCYSVRQTGTLWWAVGFHAAFDYMQLFVIGTPNGGQFPVGRLLDSHFDGPWWLTGSVLGTEASLLMYPVLALVFLYLWRRYRDGTARRADPSLVAAS